MKMTFISKIVLLLVSALTHYGSLQAADAFNEISDEAQASNLLPSTDSGFARQKCREGGEESNPNLEHLYAFNATVSTIVLFGDDVPFNNGNFNFNSPPTPLVKGKSIQQSSNTEFQINENGDYLVTFYGYTPQAKIIDASVQLFVNSIGTGPQASVSGTVVSFSQIIRISGVSKSNPALVEVRVIGVAPFPNLVLQNFGLVNATLEIIKLNI